MKFAICNETFLDWPFDRGCRLARDCGYTGIEIAPFTIATDVREISRKRRAELRHQAEEAHLQVVGLHWLLAKTIGLHLTSPDAAVRQATTEYLQELARLCHDLGGRVLVFGSPQQRQVAPGVTMHQAFDYAAEVFRGAMPVLEELDVVLAVEPLAPTEGNFLNTADDAERLIDMVDSPVCRLHLDCKAMSSERQPIPEIIAAHRARLEHFHVNDPNQLGPGMGELEFEPILAALRDIGYQGWVSVEVFDYSPGPERLARESIEYLKACLERLGA